MAKHGRRAQADTRRGRVERLAVGTDDPNVQRPDLSRKSVLDGPTHLDPLLAALHHLTEKQRQFADVYMRTRNATRSYQTVYGTEAKNVCAVKACELLENPYVDLYLRALTWIQDQKQLRIDKQEIIDVLFEIARDSGANANARVRALENLAQIAGIQGAQRVELSGPHGQPLQPTTVTSKTIATIKQQIFRIDNLDAATVVIEKEAKLDDVREEGEAPLVLPDVDPEW